MGELQELIERHCPDGVEYKSLGELGTFYRGSSFQKKHFVEEGEPCIHYGQVHTQYNLSTDHVISYLDPVFAAKMKRAKPGDLIIATTSEDDEAVGKAIAWMGDTDVVVSNDAYIYSHCLDPMYMAYIFASDLYQQPKLKYVTGTKVRRVHEKNISKIVVPVPPIEVQREIVRLLDAYTAAHDALVAKLTEDYAIQEATFEMLLSGAFSSLENVTWATLSDVSRSVMSGGTPSKSHPEYYGGDHLWLRTQEVDFCEVTTTGKTITDAGLKNSAAKLIPAGCLIVAMYGATAAKVAVNAVPMTTNQACCNLELDDERVLVWYAFYWMMLNYEKLKAMGRGSQSNISASIVKDFKIPVVSIAEQAELVALMDEMRGLTGETKSTILREIELREAQLAEFRNQILSFPEKAA